MVLGWLCWEGRAVALAPPEAPCDPASWSAGGHLSTTTFDGTRDWLVQVLPRIIGTELFPASLSYGFGCLEKDAGSDSGADSSRPPATPACSVLRKLWGKSPATCALQAGSGHRRLLKACGQAASLGALRQWGFCVPRGQPRAPPVN